ncbi:hypothetical protein PIB30_025988 [Stylosanthes scabra]|uniref:Transposase (Putative), gypsy type n=1 Tax=Stylosanthes scabra TaxID=79078 RepID=A0ABU6TCB7_9FABA|nr:hypothetical protein [Stylosanthes scabra]
MGEREEIFTFTSSSSLSNLKKAFFPIFPFVKLFDGFFVKWLKFEERVVVREVEGAQIPHELNPLYSWATRDVLGSPSTITEDYLRELKESGVICGGGDEEGHYRVEVPRRGERICELNLEHPRVPQWLWVNEVMFTEFGVCIPFTSFQQRLLQHCFVAPFQFHPNAWSAIRCFELVTEYLELPQDSEVFLFLFTVFSPNAEGKSKKGYMSVRQGKKRRIFSLYEESFHDFKGRYFKVFPIGDHPPFWLTLERDAGRFPSYWSKDAGLNYTPVSYRTLNDEQRDTADILLWLFAKRPLKPKAVLGNPERARKVIVKMAGKNKTLAELRRVMQANPQDWVEVSSPIQKKDPDAAIDVPQVPTTKKRGNNEGTSTQKRPRLSEVPQRDFCPIDRSFDATRFIESNLLTPGAREILQDHDPMESLRWAQWAMLKSTTIMKSVEPRLTVAAQFEDRCNKLVVDLRLLNQQKAEIEKGKLEADSAKLKAEKDLEAALARERERDIELQRLKDREVGLSADLESAKKGLLEEKSRANKAEATLMETEQARQELIRLTKDSVKATQDNLKEQILVLAPDFNVSLLGA